MTREEAITVLKAFMENPLFSEVHKAAFNIAIHDIKAYQDWNINNLILVNKDNYEPITKNDLGVDLVSRADVLKLMQDNWHTHNGDWAMQESMDDIRALPSVTPQEPTDKNFTKADIDAIVKAINAHWELIIDEIRAEIETEKLEDSANFCVKAHNIAVDRVLGIIDKYKAESEK